MYNFNNNGSEIEKSGIKTTYWGGKTCWQVITWSHKPCEAKNSNQVDTWTCEHARNFGTWARKHARHMSTQGKLVHKYAKHVSAFLARRVDVFSRLVLLIFQQTLSSFKKCTTVNVWHWRKLRICSIIDNIIYTPWRKRDKYYRRPI